MSIPRFTAEQSLDKTATMYVARTTRSSPSGSVHPADCGFGEPCGAGYHCCRNGNVSWCCRNDLSCRYYPPYNGCA